MRKMWFLILALAATCIETIASQKEDLAKEILSRLRTLQATEVTPSVPENLKQYYNGINPLEERLQELFHQHKIMIQAEVQNIWKIGVEKTLSKLKDGRAELTAEEKWAALPYIDKIFDALNKDKLIPYIPKESPVFTAPDDKKADYVYFWRDEFFKRLIRLPEPFPYDKQ
jgi:hypothetical protein